MGWFCDEGSFQLLGPYFLFFSFLLCDIVEELLITEKCWERGGKHPEIYICGNKYNLLSSETEKGRVECFSVTHCLVSCIWDGTENCFAAQAGALFYFSSNEQEKEGKSWLLLRVSTFDFCFLPFFFFVSKNKIVLHFWVLSTSRTCTVWATCPRFPPL